MFRPAVALLVLVLVFAGCNTVSDATPTRTLTPVDVPADPNAGLGGDELAPGVSESGVVDAQRLADAHARRLGVHNYTVNQTLTERYPNGSIESRYVTRGQFAVDKQRFAVLLTQTDRREGRLQTRTVERYADGAQVYEAISENTTQYRAVARDPAAFYPTNLTNARAIARLFTLVETRVVEQRVETGTRYVTVATADAAALPPLRNVTLTARISEEGVVERYRVEYDVEREVRVHVVVAVEYTEIGETTVIAPAWVERLQ